MTFVRNLLCAGIAAAGLHAAEPVTVSARLGAPTATTPIPRDFIGLSVEITNITPDKRGEYMFSGTNRAVITLFRNAGIRNLRVGGGTLEPKSGDPAKDAQIAVPTFKDIDQLFAFARAADVRVIYSLRLLNGRQDNAVAVARYIADHYADRLEAFSIGNEPDWHAYHTYPGHALDPEIVETVPGTPGSAYPSYWKKWREFAEAVRVAVPAARFMGPETGSNYPVPGSKDTGFNGTPWTVAFAEDGKVSGLVTAVLPHDYVGQSAIGVPEATAVDAVLSRQWPARNYPALYDAVLARVQQIGLPYRMTECNDYTGGVDGVSNAFASALWALDYARWHAAHHAIGLNYHNRRWINTCTIVQDPSGEFRVNPKAYGLRAFDVGSDGCTEELTLANPAGANITGYAVRGAQAHFVTLINKEHGANARAVTVNLPAPATGAAVMYLRAESGQPTARTGITLGDDVITADREWHGRWTNVAPAGSTVSVAVPATSAVIIRLPRS